MLIYIAVFTGSFLLFLIQPMSARVLLPAFGGSAQVWNTCMLFFQFFLFAGYAYVHWTAKKVSERFQFRVHMALAVASIVVLPQILRVDVLPPPEGSPAGWLLKFLAIRIGLPFFIIAAGTPLVQYWVTRSSHVAGTDPYHLYASSNLGSFSALILYPMLIDPTCDLQVQFRLFTLVYLAYLVMLPILKFTLPRHVPSGTVPDEGPPASGSLPPASRFKWVILSAVPSSLMLGMTAHMTQEIPSVPLLWTLPLGLYLVSFVLSFSNKPFFTGPILQSIHPVLLAVIVIVMYVPLHLGGFSLHLIALLVSATLLHGQLYRLRPYAQQLTVFYFWIAFGGMLGGIFNAILAPLLFPFALEYPLAIIAAALLSPSENRGKARKSGPLMDWLFPLFLLAASCFAVISLPHAGDERDLIARVGILFVASAVAATFRHRPLRFGLGLAAVIACGIIAFRLPGTMVMARSYYGSYRVSREAGSTCTFLYHGNTVHGGYNSDSVNHRPISCFYPESPLGRLLETKCSQHSRIAVVGLGTGSLSWFWKRGQTMVFFEIDPLVGRLAAGYFPYMEKNSNISVVYGDGRKSLELDRSLPYDLIILDAFSSDAVPVHLITVEALNVYFSRLKDGGALVFNTSNRHIRLDHLLSALARETGRAARLTPTVRLSRSELKQGLSPASWFIMCRKQGDLPRWTRGDDRWINPSEGRTVWTDRYSSLLHYLK